MGHALPDEMVPGQTGHGLGMAHHYRTPTQETRRNRVQAALRLPRQDLEGPNDGASIKERPMGLLSRSNGPGKR